MQFKIFQLICKKTSDRKLTDSFTSDTITIDDTLLAKGDGTVTLKGQLK